MLRVGDELAGKYRVERVLGQGGMGYVVAAVHLQLDQRVAIKLMMPELCEDSASVERFLREARASVRIQSEHVARVLDVGTLESGAPFMVMEFLSGHDLSEELEERGKLEISEAIDYVIQACEAVAVAHSLGIVHRDLKPANLFLTDRPDGSRLVKVLDFGISKALSPDVGTDSDSLTSTHSMVGSPRYMSPEQARKPKTVDVRTDIWSLGVIIYEFLAGDPPFDGETPLDLLAAIVTDPLPDVRETRPDVSEGLSAIICKCLEKQAERRYPNIAELARALAPYAPAASQATITRISAILRDAQSNRASSEAGFASTLRSGEAISWDAKTETLPLISASQSASDDKQTKTDFGHSQPTVARRSRVRTLALAGLCIALALVVYLISRGQRVQAESGEGRSAAAIQDKPDREPVSDRELAPSKAKAPKSAVPTVSVAESALPQAPATPPTASTPVVVKAVPIRKPKMSAKPEQTAAQAPPASTPVDPLDGRR